MRVTSYRNLLWIILLVTAFCAAASALAPSAPPGTNRVTQGTTVASPAAQVQSTKAGQTGLEVEEASVIPDSASLLPVAALVGFSFLLGGIVCGSIKTRN